jgi:hypothetical protein
MVDGKFGDDSHDKAIKDSDWFTNPEAALCLCGKALK